MSIIGGINLGNLPDYLFFFADGRTDANWQGASKGFIGDVAVNGIIAAERTSGGVPYAGTIYTNDTTLGAWQNIIDQNLTQAAGVTGEVARINGLQTDLVSAIKQINALPATPGFTSRSSGSLDGLNTQNGINEVFVINITSGLNFSNKINITGDAGDVYILRWDTDGNPNNGYQGQVKPQSGGAIVPHGGLKPTNFINVAGDMNASGGGTNPPAPYPQGPRYDDGQGALIIGGKDFAGGGFFTGYWLSTGKPDNYDTTTGLYYGETAPFSNAIFVGGWYTLTTKFSMTSGTSGVYITPNPSTIYQPAIDVEKEVSPDNGATWLDADTPPGPNVNSGINPRFRFTVTNTGNVTLTNVEVKDDVYGLIGTVASLAPGASSQFIVTGTWAAGQHVNTATATGVFQGQTVTDTDSAYWFGIEASVPAIDVEKEVSPDNGTTWFDADTAPGPNFIVGTPLLYRFTVTNTGNVALTNVTVVDPSFTPSTIIGPISLAPGAVQFQTVSGGTAILGQHENTAAATGQYDSQTVTDTDKVYWFGVAEATPAIDIEKLISVDGGLTWQDADEAPFPTIAVGAIVKYRLVITNTGSVPLTNVSVSDPTLGISTVGGTLAVGQSFEIPAEAAAQLDQHCNTASVSGTYQTQTVTDSDSACYVGVAAPAPSIDVEKDVSPDNGATWFDADTPPGPDVPAGTNPRFKFTVTNNGPVTLTNVQVTDDVFGPIGTIASLAPGASSQFIVIGMFAVGQQVNIATATGNYQGQTVTDTDNAYWFGLPAPAIMVEKLISVDDGLTYSHADAEPFPTLVSPMNPMYKFIVTNTGNVPLSQVSLMDTVFGQITIGGTLAPGASFEETRTGTFALGQHCNTADVTGVYVSEVGVIQVSSSDSACYVGTEKPLIDIEKFVSVDNGKTWLDADVYPGPLLPPGVVPQFKFVVTNNGNLPLEDIVVTDSVFGQIGTLPTLAPGDSFQWIVVG